MTEDAFQRWAYTSGIPWRVIKPYIADAMEKIRALWLEALKNLPMVGERKYMIKAHCLKLYLDCPRTGVRL